MTQSYTTWAKRCSVGARKMRLSLKLTREQGSTPQVMGVSMTRSYCTVVLRHM